MTENDFDALYAVLTDSDIMEHYPYTFDEDRVRGWIEKILKDTKFLASANWVRKLICI